MTGTINYFLGIDIGTSKISVLALRSDSPRPIDIVSENSSCEAKCENGFSEQNPEIIKAKTVFLINKIRRRVKNRISGIGLTGQMHGMLLVDKNLKPLTNLITWQDRRSEKLIPEISAKTKNISFHERGSLIRPGYMGASLYWFYKNKLVPPNVHKACFIHDWIGASLTEQSVIFTDPTDAASSGLFDIRQTDWHWQLINNLGIEKDIFPEIKNSGEITGFTGDGTPVSCAFGDNQASIFGSVYGYKEKDCININIGTGSQASIIVDNFGKLSANFEVRPYLNRKYILVGASLNGGVVYSLLKNFFESCGLKFGRISQDKIFETMNRLASTVPHGCNGLVCLPYFFGERGSEELKASFTGMDVNNFTVSHFSRSVLEGMVRILYEFYEKMGRKRKYIVGSGNAIRRNQVLQEIVKETFNMDIRLTPHEEEAAYGASLLAASVVGGYVASEKGAIPGSKTG